MKKIICTGILLFTLSILIALPAWAAMNQSADMSSSTMQAKPDKPANPFE